jgi:hypothetical protein
MNIFNLLIIYVLNIPTETRLTQISFSTSQSGLLASISNDASYISIYDIKEATNRLRHTSTTKTLLNRDLWSDEANSDLNNGFGGDGGMTSRPTNGFDYNEKNGGGGTFNREELDLPVLWKSRKSLYQTLLA